MSVSQLVPDGLHIGGTESRAGQVGVSEERDVVTVLQVPTVLLSPLGRGGGQPDAKGGD